MENKKSINEIMNIYDDLENFELVGENKFSLENKFL